MEEEKKIKEVIAEIRPYIQNDGGDIEFVKYENNIVYVKLSGACQGCQMAHVTLKEGVESAIKNEVPDVKAVEQIHE